jgi:hypothetical protein
MTKPVISTSRLSVFPHCRHSLIPARRVIETTFPPSLGSQKAAQASRLSSGLTRPSRYFDANSLARAKLTALAGTKSDFMRLAAASPQSHGAARSSIAKNKLPPSECRPGLEKLAAARAESLLMHLVMSASLSGPCSGPCFRRGWATRSGSSALMILLLETRLTRD